MATGVATMEKAQTRLDTRSIFGNCPARVEGLPDRHGVNLVCLYHRDGLVVDGTMIVPEEERP
jgi:hypothetical protein